MVTTRSSTGALPQKKKQKRAITDKSDDIPTKTDDYVRDEKAVIGDNDKMSRLPFDVLLSIFNLLHPWNLLQLTLTSRTYRAFLTSNASESIWQDALQGLTIYESRTPDPRYGSKSTFSFRNSSSAPTSANKASTAVIAHPFPAKPSKMNNIQFISLVFRNDRSACIGGYWGTSGFRGCPFCGNKQKYPKYVEAYGVKMCNSCRKEQFVKTTEMKLLWSKDPDIDRRVWLLVPRVNGKVWPAFCDKLRQEYADLELLPDFDEDTFEKWFKRKSQELSELRNLPSSLSVWNNRYESIQASNYASHKESNKRVLADFWDGYTVADVEDLMSTHGNFIPYQDRALTSEQAIRLFNTYGASLPLIRKHREAYEQYEEETQLRENLLNLIETSLSNESGADLAADNDVKPIILGNLGNRMPQIAQLPAVRAFFRILNDNYDRDADDAVEPESDDWGARWPEIRKDLEQLQEQCCKALDEKIRDSDQSRLDEHSLTDLSTSFGCSKCGIQHGLSYPEVLDHSCFFQIPHISSYSKRNGHGVARRPGDFSTVNVTFKAVRCRRLQRFAKAITKAGGQLPTNVEDRLDGHLVCRRCQPARKYDTMTSFLNHYKTVTTVVTRPEVGVEVTTKTTHDIFRFVPAVDETGNDTASRK